MVDYLLIIVSLSFEYCGGLDISERLVKGIFFFLELGFLMVMVWVGIVVGCKSCFGVVRGGF